MTKDKHKNSCYTFLESRQVTFHSQRLSIQATCSKTPPCVMWVSYQQGEPRATARGLGLVDEVFERLSHRDEGLVLLQVPVVLLPLRLPLVPDRNTYRSVQGTHAKATIDERQVQCRSNNLPLSSNSRKQSNLVTNP